MMTMITMIIMMFIMLMMMIMMAVMMICTPAGLVSILASPTGTLSRWPLDGRLCAPRAPPDLGWRGAGALSCLLVLLGELAEVRLSLRLGVQAVAAA